MLYSCLCLALDAHSLRVNPADLLLSLPLPSYLPPFAFALCASLRLCLLSPVVPSLSLVGFLLGFQCGWGPLAMLVSTELFPPQHRGTVGGAAVAVNWITSFVVTQTFQPLVNALGGSTSNDANVSAGIGEVIIFVFYSAITTFATIWLYRRLPETNKVFLQPAASVSLP